MLYRTEEPYLKFSREQWGQLRRDMPLHLTEDDIGQLRGQIESISMSEVVEIYLPLSRLLNFYVSATQALHTATQEFLGRPADKVPYIIGITGSVAVGKSLSSRLVQALLSQWPNHPDVALVTTDGFLHSNAQLEQRGLNLRKGFPESFDREALLQFVIDLKGGKPNLKVPQYSHHNYDVIENHFLEINQPDIVIIEGLNLVQPEILQPGEKAGHFVSDFVDFSIYVDADTQHIKEWFVKRFMLFRDFAREKTQDFFNRFAALSDEAAVQLALQIWTTINEVNLVENILPYKERADLILIKAADHAVNEVWLRKI